MTFAIKTLLLIAALTGVGLGLFGHPNDIKPQRVVVDSSGHPNEL